MSISFTPSQLIDVARAFTIVRHTEWYLLENGDNTPVLFAAQLVVRHVYRFEREFLGYQQGRYGLSCVRKYREMLVASISDFRVLVEEDSKLSSND